MKILSYYTKINILSSHKAKKLINKIDKIDFEAIESIQNFYFDYTKNISNILYFKDIDEKFGLISEAFVDTCNQLFNVKNNFNLFYEFENALDSYLEFNDKASYQYLHDIIDREIYRSETIYKELKKIIDYFKLMIEILGLPVIMEDYYLEKRYESQKEVLKRYATNLLRSSDFIQQQVGEAILITDELFYNVYIKKIKKIDNVFVFAVRLLIKELDLLDQMQDTLKNIEKFKESL
jgi:hypothetical protein